MLGKPPMDIDLPPLKPTATVYDIVYVPLETGLLAKARARGHRRVDGLGMWLHQAVPGFAHWFGATPVVTPELRKLMELREALVAMKGPLGNVPAFRKAIQGVLEDDAAREKLLRELTGSTDGKTP
eukprot:gene18086-22865_t